MTINKILSPLPLYGLDPTEVAIPWKVLTAQGFRVHFDGTMASADQYMLDGQGLGPFGFLLKARKDARLAYDEMIACETFRNPVSFADTNGEYFSGLLLAYTTSA